MFQNAVGILTSGVADPTATFPWYWHLVGYLVFFVVCFFVYLVGKHLLANLNPEKPKPGADRGDSAEDLTTGPSMRWEECADFPVGLTIQWFWSKPRSLLPKLDHVKKVKYSQARWLDVAYAVVLARPAKYVDWKPVASTGFARARAKSFKNRMGGQFHKFRGGSKLQYTFYITESVLKLALMVSLAVLAGPGNAMMQAGAASALSIINALLVLVACPYNNFGQNMNEIRAGFLKPAIFILALLAAMAPPELRGIWGTGMVMTQRQDSNFTSPTRAALNCWGGSWFYLHETQTNFSLKVQHSQSLLSKSVEVEWDLCTAFM